MSVSARTLLSVVGARPNFMKLAPVVRALARRPAIRHYVVHTGQHYDPEMSASFLAELQIPAPDHNLDVGSGSHAQQTATIMQRLEPVLLEARPGMILVYGDVNSTVAAALVASKLGIGVAHVEAGLRSRDWSMPEEVNRVVTDRLSDLLFAPSRDGVVNLLAEGVPAERIHLVGNTMIDSLIWALPAAEKTDAPARHGVEGAPYVLVTLHRPSNVDHPDTLLALLKALQAVGQDRPVLFPVHPRTRERIRALGWREAGAGDVRLLEPLPYLTMLGLTRSASLVLTDSGGLQEETSFLGIPCVTVRPNTERPVTCELGTNRLVAPDTAAILSAVGAALATGRNRRAPIPRWDGRTAERIAGVLCEGARYD